MSSQISKWKKRSAERASELVEDEMIVGLGSGTTLAEVVKVLGDKESGAELAAASTATQRLAEKMGLNLVSLEEGSKLDIVIDGAVEVDPDFGMIKGGSGAHTRGRIVASAAAEVAIVVDRTKLVDNLGESHPVPVEVVPFSHDYIAGLLRNFGGEPSLRKSPSGGPFVTDNGNYIIDVDFGPLDDPANLEERLNQVPGVVDNGIFMDVADSILVGDEDGSGVLESKQDFLGFQEK